MSIILRSSLFRRALCWMRTLLGSRFTGLTFVIILVEIFFSVFSVLLMFWSCNLSVQSLTFSGYDFGYLLRVLTAQLLPETEQQFFELMRWMALFAVCLLPLVTSCYFDLIIQTIFSSGIWHQVSDEELQNPQGWIARSCGWPPCCPHWTSASGWERQSLDWPCILSHATGTHACAQYFTVCITAHYRICCFSCDTFQLSDIPGFLLRNHRQRKIQRHSLWAGHIILKLLALLSSFFFVAQPSTFVETLWCCKFSSVREV